MPKCGECGAMKKRPSKPDKKRLQELGLIKVKKQIAELEEQKIKLYESMNKILSGNFKYEVSDYKDADWYCKVEIESTDFNEHFFIVKDTGKSRYTI